MGLSSPLMERLYHLKTVVLHKSFSLLSFRPSSLRESHTFSHLNISFMHELVKLRAFLIDMSTASLALFGGGLCRSFYPSSQAPHLIRFVELYIFQYLRRNYSLEFEMGKKTKLMLYIKLLLGMEKNIYGLGSLKGKQPPQALHHINQFRFQYRNDSIFL
jgi:hypothetical protein